MISTDSISGTLRSLYREYDSTELSPEISIKEKTAWMNFTFLQPLKKSDPATVTHIFTKDSVIYRSSDMALSRISGYQIQQSSKNMRYGLIRDTS